MKMQGFVVIAGLASISLAQQAKTSNPQPTPPAAQARSGGGKECPDCGVVSDPDGEPVVISDGSIRVFRHKPDQKVTPPSNTPQSKKAVRYRVPIGVNSDGSIQMSSAFDSGVSQPTAVTIGVQYWNSNKWDEFDTMTVSLVGGEWSFSQAGKWSGSDKRPIGRVMHAVSGIRYTHTRQEYVAIAPGRQTARLRIGWMIASDKRIELGTGCTAILFGDAADTLAMEESPCALKRYTGKMESIPKAKGSQAMIDLSGDNPSGDKMLGPAPGQKGVGGTAIN